MFWLLVFLAHAQVSGDPLQTVNETRAEERGVLTQLDLLDQDLAALQAEANGLLAQQREYENQLNQHREGLAETEQVLTKYREDTIRRIRALYKLYRRGLARIVFGAEDPVNLRRRGTYLMAIIRADASRISQFSSTVSEKETAVVAIQEAMTSLEGITAEIQFKEAQLREQREKKMVLLNEIRTKREVALQAISEMSLEQNNPQTVGQQWNETPSSQQDFKEAFGSLPWPVSGTVTKRFGSYTDPQSNERATSSGIDIESPFGTPIRAVFGGTVQIAEFIRGYGQTILLQHGQYATIYAHASGLRVRRGQQVSAGDVLGYVGNTGLTNDESSLLTFEVRLNGAAQDPLRWLEPR